MLYVTVLPNGGRFAHRLFDIISGWIFKYLIEIECKWCYNDRLFKNNIIDLIDIKYDSPSITELGEYVGINLSSRPFKERKYEEILEKINSVKKLIQDNPDKNILVTFVDSFRIYPYQIDNWFQQKKISVDAFSMLKQELITRYNIAKPIQQTSFKEGKLRVSVHIRRGDRHYKYLHDPTYKKYSHIGFYDNLIKNINANFENVDIHVFTEPINSKDVYKLSDRPNVTVFTERSVEEDFNELINCDILCMAISGLSIFASYMTKALVIYNDSTYYFDHKQFPNNFVQVNENGEFDIIKAKTYLNNNCDIFASTIPPSTL